MIWISGCGKKIENTGITEDNSVEIQAKGLFLDESSEGEPEETQDTLNNLKYGNCDIRDWEGRLNTNNNNRPLTGFWVEASLLISPREQTDCKNKIYDLPCKTACF